MRTIIFNLILRTFLVLFLSERIYIIYIYIYFTNKQLFMLLKAKEI